MPTKKPLILLLLFIPYLLTSCDSSPPPSLINESRAIPIKIEKIVFGKLKGPKDYQYFSPLQGSPLGGNTYIKITTIGDVTSIDVTINSGANVSKKYTTKEPNKLDKYVNEWIINVDLPTGESTVFATVKAKNGTQYSLVKKVSTQSTKIQLKRSSLTFSPGENYVNAQVINFGEDSEFILSATDNYSIISKQFTSKTLFLEKGKFTVVKIPVNFPRNLDSDILDYSIEVQLKNSVTADINLVRMNMRVDASPTGISDNYKLVVTNLGKCSPIARNKSTVTVAIAGSSKLILDNVDKSSIFWMNGRIKPISATITDKVSFDNHNCNNLQPDGLNDLIMTYPLSEILGARDPSITSWSARINYRNKNGRSGDVLYFEMGTGE